MMVLLSKLIVFSALMAQGQPYDWGWGMHPLWWGWGLGMMLMMLIFWGLVTAGIVILIRWLLAQGKESRSDSAVEILRQRYARGEINKEQFETMEKELI
jgi:putative membrane protein